LLLKYKLTTLEHYFYAKNKLIRFAGYLNISLESLGQAGDGVAIACHGKDASGFGKSSSIYNCHMIHCKVYDAKRNR
jgi:hypothetical protein